MHFLYKTNNPAAAAAFPAVCTLIALLAACPSLPCRASEPPAPREVPVKEPARRYATAISGSKLFVAEGNAAKVAARDDMPVQPPRDRNPLDVNSLGDFDEGLAALSEAFRVTLVAEDAPLRTALDEKKKKELEGLSLGTSNLSNVLAWYAEAYDYDVTAYNPECYVLRKRFTSPDDMPCVTLKEWRASLGDVCDLLEAFSPNMDRDLYKSPVWKEFINSFTPEQLAAMKPDEENPHKRGLGISSLSARQQDTVRLLCYLTYIQRPLSDIQGFKAHADLADGDRTTIGWVARGNKSKTKFFAFGDPARMADIADRKGGTFVALPGGEEKFENRIRFDPLEAKTPGPGERLDRRPNPLLRTTLGQIAREMTAGEPARSRGIVFGVDPMLSEKRVSVSGGQYSRPGKLFRAAASAYGLEVRYAPKDQEYALSRRRVKPSKDLDRLAQAIMDALPAPFLRRMKLSAAGAPPVAGDTPPAPEGREAYPEYDWYSISVDGLRRSVKKRVDGSGKDAVSVSEIGEDRALLTNALMAEAGDLLRKRVRVATPPYIRDFDSIEVKGGPNKKHNADFFSIGVYIWYGDGFLSPYWTTNVRTTPLKSGL